MITFLAGVWSMTGGVLVGLVLVVVPVWLTYRWKGSVPRSVVLTGHDWKDYPKRMLRIAAVEEVVARRDREEALAHAQEMADDPDHPDWDDVVGRMSPEWEAIANAGNDEPISGDEP